MIGSVGLLGGRDQSEAAHRLAAQHVLHVHGVAGAEQRAVEDRVRGHRRLPALRRQLEAPRLDAVAPRRVDEAQVAVGLRGDEQPAVQPVQRRGGVVVAVVEAVEVLEALARERSAARAPRRAGR